MREQDESIVPHQATPLVGRPRGAAWRALQADGVVWEGQVFLVGGDLDLAARMIVTHRRLAFARGGEIVLDVARPWLRPAPYLRRDGTVLLSIVPPGARYGEPPETVALRMREGQPAAGHLVAMLAGSGARHVPADLDALEAIIRPALPQHPGSAHQLPAGDWPNAPVASPGAPLVRRPETSTTTPSPGLALAGPLEPAWSNPDPAPDPNSEPVVRQSAAPVASGRDRDWNLPMREHVVPRGQRRSRWGWALRLTGLVGLLSTAAAFGAGRIPSPLDSFGTAGQRPTATTLVGTTTAGPTLIAQGAAEQTAMALGVGGPDRGVAPAERAASQGERSPVEVGRGSLAAPAAPVPTAPPPAVIAMTGAETAAAGDDSRAAAQVETETPDATPTRPAGAETVAPGPTATREATAVPAAEPTVATAPEAEPTAAPAPDPTTPPAPTSVPATAEPQPTPTVAAPTEAPAPTPVPEPTAAQTSAPAAIDTPATASPATASPEAALAFAPRLAVGGRTLPAFGLPPSTDGNWLVVVVDAANAGDEPASVALDAFRLRADDGTESPIDPGADLVASIVGMEEAGGDGDTVELGPDEARRLLLLFQVDPAASGLELLVGEATVDLTDALAAGGDVSDLPEEPSAP
ncbi:MAG: hypothetical protein AVDCRST_MAG59-3006 [uncultured Thermomicrobiales bacterium]|uniref:DUF4352 domain-containing protein n=1 Tax=uncultured Thermomicrobiales bacterium TaxID=1645740 RepID=A0A6J4V0L5_9BACT|nr:MAG: hypothetical protein AVDCRST_MAG59-3006 [uncultured Thermomicrobiales bacterium]